MSQVELESVRTKFRQHEKDTGSCDVQVAVLTKKIEHLTEHLKANAHDHNSRRGLIKMVNQRRTLLDYLKRTDEPRYIALVKELGLRR
ncbi:MAG: 30S ribosomal protein S15 [Kiritimatiellae bacterium]|nr:30S ribosomal protein S15 [Kiritimatiellia bacterium]